MAGPRSPVVAYVGLGANLGDSAATVLGAMDALNQVEGTSVTRRSGLYRSAPVQASGPNFVNAVVELQTRLCAPELLKLLQHIEDAAGRERPYPNAPRTLDLDLLIYGDATMISPTLTLPHPRMTQRAFVLQPLAEIALHRVAVRDLLAVTDQAIIRM